MLVLCTGVSTFEQYAAVLGFSLYVINLYNLIDNSQTNLFVPVGVWTLGSGGLTMKESL